MLHNTIINILHYSYPIGNTSAVHLTEQLAWEQDADILLLGCGDVRNILFTVYCDAKLGKTLLIQSKNNAKKSRTWKIRHNLLRH